MRPLMMILMAMLLVTGPVMATSLDSLVRAHPADSLVVPLRRFENETGHGSEGARAAFTLGQLHYARGENRRAAEAFSRAAARLDPAHKTEARYWAGMSWLALGEAAQARAVFEELVEPGAPRRSEALFGTAVAWALAGHADRALEILDPLAREVRGESAPAVLERTITLAHEAGREDLAAAATQRLTHEFPHSIEAGRAGLVTTARKGIHVELGPFPNEAQAHAAADKARHAGFEGATVRVRADVGTRGFFVTIEGLATGEAAKRAAESMHHDLGVPAHVVGTP